MNMPRMLILAVATIAAGAAAFLARGFLGGGTPAVVAHGPRRHRSQPAKCLSLRLRFSRASR